MIGLLLASCGGGGGSGGGNNGASSEVSCAYLRGHVNTISSGAGGCVNCTVRNPQNAADGNLNTAFDLFTGTGQQTYTGIDNGAAGTFPAGSNAGAFVTLSGGASTSGITFTTYLANVAQDTATGTMITTTPTNGKATPASYLSFTTSRSFDSIGISVSATSGMQFSFYEFCGGASIR